MGALLSLSPERIGRERRRAIQAADDDRRWLRNTWIAIGVAGLWLVAAYVLLFLSFWVDDPDQGNVAFWAALTVGNFGPVITGFRFWVRAET